MSEFKPFNVKFKLEIWLELKNLFSDRDFFLKEQQIKTVHNYNDNFKIDDLIDQVSIETLIKETYIDEIKLSKAHIGKGQEISPNQSTKRFKVQCFFESIEYKVLYINDKIYTLENLEDSKVFSIDINHYQNDSLEIERV